MSMNSNHDSNNSNCLEDAGLVEDPRRVHVVSQDGAKLNHWGQDLADHRLAFGWVRDVDCFHFKMSKWSAKPEPGLPDNGFALVNKQRIHRNQRDLWLGLEPPIGP